MLNEIWSTWLSATPFDSWERSETPAFPDGSHCSKNTGLCFFVWPGSDGRCYDHFWEKKGSENVANFFWANYLTGL